MGRWFESLWRHHVISLCKTCYTLSSTGTTQDMSRHDRFFFDWNVKYQLQIIEVNSCSVLVCYKGLLFGVGSMMELSNVLFSSQYWFNLDNQGNVAT